MNKKIRWKQRFSNLNKSFSFLKESCQQTIYSNLEIGGLIKAFEFTFELSWKTLKDYLESVGLEEKFPREIIKTSFENDLIKDGKTWIEMLDKRNELPHTYDENSARSSVAKIKEKYLPALEQVFIKLKELYEK